MIERWRVTPRQPTDRSRLQHLSLEPLRAELPIRAHGRSTERRARTTLRPTRDHAQIGTSGAGRPHGSERLQATISSSLQNRSGHLRPRDTCRSTVVLSVVVEWKLDLQRRSAAARALQRNGAADRLDTISEPEQSRTTCGVGSAHAIVSDRETKHAVLLFGGNVYDRRMGVLRRIRERLRDDVVRRHFDPPRKPQLVSHVEFDRNGRAASEHLDRCPEPALGQNRGVDPSAISRSSSSTLVRPSTTRDSSARSGLISGGTAACEARRSSASETSRCCAPSCRSRSIRRRVASAVATIRAARRRAPAALGIRDRGRDELRELREAPLRVEG